jgi:hypothetical protein
MSYLDHNCRKCNTNFHYQVPRSTLFKILFGFLPIRIYWCPKCMVNRYVWRGYKKSKDITYTAAATRPEVKKSA